MKLTITLSPTEEANIAGWANHFTAHPEQVPTRVVLEERTQERLREIAAQFGAVPPVTPPSVVIDFGVISPERTRTDWLQVAPGVIFSAVAPAAGRVAANVGSGGDRVEISPSPSFPPIEGQLVGGAGTSGWLTVTAGQRIYGRHFAAQVQSVRWDWLPQ